MAVISVKWLLAIISQLTSTIGRRLAIVPQWQIGWSVTHLMDEQKNGEKDGYFAGKRVTILIEVAVQTK